MGQVFFCRLRGVVKVNTLSHFSLVMKENADYTAVKLEAKRRWNDHVKLLHQPRGQFNDFRRKVYRFGQRITEASGRVVHD